jgi:magnesium chelatase subunit I
MHAEIKTVKDPSLRVQIVEQRSQFDQDPYSCIQEYAHKQDLLKSQIIDAQQLLPEVIIDFSLRMKISQICAKLDVDGLRGDIVTNRAAKAFASYHNKKKVDVNDIKKVITLCLRHRLRKDPLESIDSGMRVQQITNEIFGG